MLTCNYQTGFNYPSKNKKINTKDTITTLWRSQMIIEPRSLYIHMYMYILCLLPVALVHILYVELGTIIVITRHPTKQIFTQKQWDQRGILPIPGFNGCMSICGQIFWLRLLVLNCVHPLWSATNQVSPSRFISSLPTHHSLRISSTSHSWPALIYPWATLM